MIRRNESKEEKLSARHHSYTEHMVYMRERRTHNEQINNASSQQERRREKRRRFMNIYVCMYKRNMNKSKLDM